MTMMPDADDVQLDVENAPPGRPSAVGNDAERINTPPSTRQASATNAGVHADKSHAKSVLDVIQNGDATAIMRHLLETGDPIVVAALLDPDPKASLPYKLELKRRRPGRPTRSAQSAIAAKVRAAAATGAKVESQFADLKANGVSRSSANRYRKFLGLNEKK